MVTCNGSVANYRDNSSRFHPTLRLTKRRAGWSPAIAPSFNGATMELEPGTASPVQLTAGWANEHDPLYRLDHLFGSHAADVSVQHAEAICSRDAQWSCHIARP